MIYETYSVGGELYHHGVKGMKWGVRRYQPYTSGYQRKNKEKGTYFKKDDSILQTISKIDNFENEIVNRTLLKNTNIRLVTPLSMVLNYIDKERRNNINKEGKEIKNRILKNGKNKFNKLKNMKIKNDNNLKEGKKIFKNLNYQYHIQMENIRQNIQQQQEQLRLQQEQMQRQQNEIVRQNIQQQNEMLFNEQINQNILYQQQMVMNPFMW